MDKGDTKPVGQRIKSAREEKDLSVEKLASLAGCSAEFLEWVEDGQVIPPVALLLQLAKTLQLNSGTFLKDDDMLNQRLDEAAKRTKHYSYETLTPPDTDKHLMAFSVTVPPRTAHKGVGYQHEGEELLYVLSGELEVVVDQEKRNLAKKESYRFNSNLDHHFSNPGDVETELLVVLYLP